MDAKRLKFLMDIDETFDNLSKEFPNEESLLKLQDKFYNLANKTFIKNAYQGLFELSVEDVLKKQANEFYKDFPLKIQNELVEAFIEMEHHRRRDNLEGFCMSIFRQVECYVNELFKSGKLLQEIISNRRKRIFISRNIKWDKDEIPPKYIRYDYLHGNDLQFALLKYKVNGSFFNISDYDKHFNDPNFNILDDVEKKCYFQIRFRIILFLLYFNQNVDEWQFEETEALFYEIQQLRNLSHGGKMSSMKQNILLGKPLDKQEKIIVESIENKQINFLKYQGFLANFMQKISNSPNLANSSLQL